MSEKKTIIPHFLSCCTSIVCMGQMGATIAATGSAGMMAMGATQTVPFITSMLQAIGLGFLVALPDAILRPALIIILAITIFGSWISFKAHNNPKPFALTIFGSISVYSSIYIFVSEMFYWISFALLLVAAIWTNSVIKKKM